MREEVSGRDKGFRSGVEDSGQGNSGRGVVDRGLNGDRVLAASSERRQRGTRGDAVIDRAPLWDWMVPAVDGGAAASRGSSYLGYN